MPIVRSTRVLALSKIDRTFWIVKIDAYLPIFMLNEKIRVWLEGYNAYRPRLHQPSDPFGRVYSTAPPTSKEVHTMHAPRTEVFFRFEFNDAIQYSSRAN